MTYPTFADILGHADVLHRLTTQLQSDHLHHAYIFHGPAGVGKFTTALAFAQALLSHDDGTQHLQIAAGHADLHVINKELARYHSDSTIRNRKLTQIPVEIIRESLIEPVYKAPQQGDRKVFIVDEAELLNPAGQNALLKSLEEPPAGTTLILVTPSEDRLLPTIRSRCQRLSFLPLPDETVAKWLQDNSSLSAELQRWAVRFAQGSLGRAKLVVDYDLSAWATTVLPKIDQMAKRPPRPDGTLGETIAKLVDDFAKAWVEHHENASKEAANKLGASLMWSMLGSHARLRLSTQAEKCDANDVFAAEAMLEPWLGMVDALEKTQAMVRSNVNMGLVCDHLVAEIAGALGGRIGV